MKKWLLLGGLVVVVTLVATLVFSGVSALAQGPDEGQPGWGWGRFGNHQPFGGFGHGPMGGPGGFGGPMGGPDEFGAGPFFGPGRFGGSIDRQALLAEALGITVEELQAAQEEANRAAIQQAVDEELMTQEQADLMLSRMALRSYLDRDALVAEALGITVEELEAARTEGKPLMVLMYELDLEPATVRTALQTAYEEAVQQAVTDGVITQEQADEILESGGPGFGGPGRFRGGFGGPRWFGGFGGFWR